MLSYQTPLRACQVRALTSYSMRRACRALFARVLACGTLSYLLMPLQAWADSWDVNLGDSRILATYYEIRDQKCMALMAPIVRVLRQPTLGSVVIMQTQAVAKDSRRCSSTLVPVTQVLYQANRLGSDDLAWEVKFQAPSRGIERHDAHVTVRGPRR